MQKRHQAEAGCRIMGCEVRQKRPQRIAQFKISSITSVKTSLSFAPLALIC